MATPLTLTQIATKVKEATIINNGTYEITALNPSKFYEIIFQRTNFKTSVNWQTSLGNATFSGDGLSANSTLGTVKNKFYSTDKVELTVANVLAGHPLIVQLIEF